MNWCDCISHNDAGTLHSVNIWFKCSYLHSYRISGLSVRVDWHRLGLFAWNMSYIHRQLLYPVRDWPANGVFLSVREW